MRPPDNSAGIYDSDQLWTGEVESSRSERSGSAHWVAGLEIESRALASPFPALTTLWPPSLPRAGCRLVEKFLLRKAISAASFQRLMANTD